MDTKNSNETADQLADEHVELLAPILALTPIQQRFVHLFITGTYTLQKLASLLEVHPNTLSNWLKRKDIRTIIADMQESTHEVAAHQLKNMSAKAVSRLSDLLDSPIDGVALQAVKDVLDRAGHKPKQEIKIDKTITTIEEKMRNLIDSTIIDVESHVE